MFWVKRIAAIAAAPMRPATIAPRGPARDEEEKEELTSAFEKQTSRKTTESRSEIVVAIVNGVQGSHLHSLLAQGVPDSYDITLQLEARTHHAEHVASGRAPLGTKVEHAIEADFESRTGGLSNTLDGSIRSADHET